MRDQAVAETAEAERSNLLEDCAEEAINSDQNASDSSPIAQNQPATERSNVINEYRKAAITTDQPQPSKVLSVISDYGKAVITGDQPVREQADPHARGNVRSFVRTNEPIPSGRTNERTSGSTRSPTACPLESEKITQLFCSPEVGLSEADALRLAANHAYEWLERQTFAWLNERKQGRVETTGALFSRIRQRFSAPELTREDKSSALYQRLHPNRHEEADQARRRRYLPEQYRESNFQ